MKTPMQELLEEVINAREIAMGVDFRSALDFVRDAIEEDYLEKEKEVIVNAVKKGWDYNEEGFVQWMGETYYNETFNTKEK